MAGEGIVSGKQLIEENKELINKFEQLRKDEEFIESTFQKTFHADTDNNFSDALFDSSY